MRKNLKVYSALLSLVLAGNVLSLANAKSETVNDGNIYETDKVICNTSCDTYVVKEGDTFFDIARKISSHYREAEGNNYQYIDIEKLSQLLIKMNAGLLPINPSDIIYFPATSNACVNLIWGKSNKEVSNSSVQVPNGAVRENNEQRIRKGCDILLDLNKKIDEEEYEWKKLQF